MKKLDELMKKRELTIASNDTLVKDPYVIITLTDSKGNYGVGISKAGRLDKFNETIGIKIAKDRAEGALFHQLIRKPIHSGLMGSGTIPQQVK